MSGSKVPLEQMRGEMRKEVVDAHAAAWAWIAMPGTWLTGAQRVAVAQETRLARDCDLCARRKEALSPIAEVGEHDHSGVLEQPLVEAIHKLASDPGRLSKKWLDNLFEAGLEDGVYVESAGIVAMVCAMDSYTFALDAIPGEAPHPVAGAISRYRPPGARITDTWVATISPGAQVPEDGPVYGARASGVHRALSLVPATKIAVFNLLMAHYISPNLIMDFDQTDIGRSISRPQAEIIASRVSVLNQCLF